MFPRNLIIRQGRTFRRTFKVEGLSDTDVVNAEIRRWPGGPLLGLFSTVVEPYVNELTLILTAEQTADIDRSGVFDIEIVTVDGDVLFVASGNAVLKPRITTGRSPSSNPRRLGWGLASWGNVPWPVSLSNSNLPWGNKPWGLTPWE